MAMFEIPLFGSPQSFQIDLSGVTYRLTFIYRSALMGGWFVDIFDANDAPLVCGVPLVTGADLLAQYGYLGFGGEMVVESDGNPEARPTFDNLGRPGGSHVFWETDDA